MTSVSCKPGYTPLRSEYWCILVYTRRTVSQRRSSPVSNVTVSCTLVQDRLSYVTRRNVQLAGLNNQLAETPLSSTKAQRRSRSAKAGSCPALLLLYSKSEE